MAAAGGGLGAAIKARAVQLRNTLAGAGIPADLDGGSVDPPGAWVRVVTAEPATVTGWTVRFHVWLIAPAVSVIEAWDLLAPLLDKALTVVDPDEPINTATAVSLPHTPTQPLPAFLLVVDELVEPEE